MKRKILKGNRIVTVKRISVFEDTVLDLQNTYIINL